MDRRSFIAGCAAVAASQGWTSHAGATTPESDELEQHDLVLDGDKKLARRSLLLVPKHVPPGRKLPMLVLLHGLGETGNEMLGIHAWGDRYGLVRAYERLCRPPVERLYPKQSWFSDDHIARVNRSLARRPFGGVVLVCPVTPNPYKLQPAARTLDRYADWIEQTLLPAVRERAPVSDGARHTGLDGCSLGGYVGVEVFLRKPHLFGSFGGVQSAFSAPAALSYAERIAKALADIGPRPIRLGSSGSDPYAAANRAFAKKLDELGVPNELSIPPGPHNQPWLKEVGTLDMLLWHERKLALASRP
jgi:enterochelin esterase-like enzyme